MMLDFIALYRYQIALSPSLPVASQRINQRLGLVLELASGDKHTWVEIAPLSGTDDNGQALHGFSRERLEQVEHQLSQDLPRLFNQPQDALLACIQHRYPSLDLALSLAHAKLTERLAPARTHLAPIGLVYGHRGETDAELAHRLELYLTHYQGNFLKIKVGQRPWQQDLALIYQVLAHKPKLRLRLDANRHYSLEDAIDFCACLPKANIDYIEEPCANVTDCQAVYQATGIGFALDESLCAPDAHYQPMAGLKALVLKPMLIGDLAKLQAMIGQAAADGVRSVISSSLEASLGIHDLALIAAQLTPDEAPGLDTLSAFSQDLLISTANKPCLTTADLTLVLQLGQKVK
ncbi:MAG: o-succinylbenzoate synthase [Shewanella sp.]